MAQLNVSIDDALALAADRLASITDVTRPELVRRLLREAIAAQEDGRPVFSQPTAPADLATLGDLSHRINEQTIELDRVLRAHDKRTARLERSHQNGEHANRLAYETLAKQLRVHLGEGYKPFHDLMECWQAEFTAQTERIHTAITDQPKLAEIATHLDSLDETVRQSEPPVHNHWRGYGYSWKGWSAIGLACFCASTLLLLVLAKILPDDWIANPLALYAYGSHRRAICALYENATGAIQCPIVSAAPSPEASGRAGS